jgi:hypothetical protein
MCDEKRWNDGGWDEERGAERRGVKPADQSLIKCVQEIGRAPHVEHPNQADGPGQAPDQGESGGNREHGSHEVSVRGGSGQRPRERGRNHSGDQEAQSDEPERVGDY